MDHFYLEKLQKAFCRTRNGLCEARFPFGKFRKSPWQIAIIFRFYMR